MYNVIKLNSPFEKLKNYDYSPEVKLSKAVILQAIIDATNRSDRVSLKKNEVEAMFWLFEDGDFLEVCDNAMLCPHKIRKEAKISIFSKNCIKTKYTRKAKEGKLLYA